MCKKEERKNIGGVQTKIEKFIENLFRFKKYFKF